MSSDLERVLSFPAETWTQEETIAVAHHRAGLHEEMVAIADSAERDERDLTAEEAERFSMLQTKFDGIPSVPAR